MTEITLISYDKKDLIKTTMDSFDEISSLDKTKEHWIHVVSEEKNILHKLAEVLNLHPLVLEDLCDLNQRSKFEDHEEYIFTILSTNYYIDNELEGLNVGFILYDDLLISVVDKHIEKAFDPMHILKKERTIKKYKLDYVLYSLIDELFDNQYSLLDTIGDKIDIIEGAILEAPETEQLNAIYQIKKDLIYIRKSLWPNQNVMRSLEMDTDLISTMIRFYFQDIYNVIIQSIDILETYHEICSSMQDTYLSSISNKTNEIMKVLTVFSTIFIPLTFLTSMYGMNFKYLPEINWKLGYLYFWILCIVIFVGMMAFFKKKRWY